MDVLILAGGLGTRLQASFPDTAKPIVPVNEVPFLLVLLKLWASPEVSRFVISIGHLAEQIIKTVGPSFAGIPIVYVTEVEPQGTGGAVLKAMQEAKLSLPFVLLNGDTFFPVKISDLLARNENYVMALRNVSDASSAGRANVTTEGIVTDFLPPAAGASLINGGVALIRKLNYQNSQRPLSLENDIIPALLKSGENIGSIVVSSPFVDIGTPQGHREACNLLVKEIL